MHILNQKAAVKSRRFSRHGSEKASDLHVNRVHEMKLGALQRLRASILTPICFLGETLKHKSSCRATQESSWSELQAPSKAQHLLTQKSCCKLALL